jgi:hypothetical protein
MKKKATESTGSGTDLTDWKEQQHFLQPSQQGADLVKVCYNNSRWQPMHVLSGEKGFIQSFSERTSR